MNVRVERIWKAQIWLFAAMLLALLAPPQAARAATSAKPRLLVLHSYHSGLPWSQGLMKGVQSALKNTGLDIDLRVEYLDAFRYQNDALFSAAEALLAAKYVNIRPSVVLTTDDVALDFVLARRDRLFPGIPLVFCAPNNFSADRIRGHTDITGVTEAPDFKGTLNLALGLHPNAGIVALVSDREPAALRRLQQVKSVEADFRNRVAFRLLTDASLPELKAELKALPRESIVLFLNFLKDRTGKRYRRSIDVLRQLSQDTPLPFYTYKKIDVGEGAVGGRVISETLMARRATAMAIEILKGTPAADIPIVYRTPTVALFDHRMLKRFDLSNRQLPAPHELVNAPRSFYQIHKTRVWTAGAVLLVMFLLVLILSVNVWRRRRAEGALREAQRMLEDRVAQRTEELVRANDNLRREIAERKEAEKKRHQLEERLRHAHKMEAVGTLAGGIAHDFNNLLMVIAGNASLLRIGMKNNDSAVSQVEAIEKSVQSGATLTQQLLGYARKGNYQLAPLDLNRLITEMAETFGRTHRGIDVCMDLAKRIPTVHVDRSQMEQLLLNLWSNAADAMANRGRLTVATCVVSGEEHPISKSGKSMAEGVRLTVTDTGMGMDEPTRKRIFDPFFTTKKMGRGTGLGLASAYGIVKNCGGRIDVTSTPGRGTRFCIDLPAGPAADPIPASSPEPAASGQGTILLVDDEELVADVGRQMLENLEYRVLTAVDGPTAIDRFEKHQKDIDLVILDMTMPVMGGAETYERLRALDRDVKVLIASGYGSRGEAETMLAKGCLGFIQKPYGLNELGRKVQEALTG